MVPARARDAPGATAPRRPRERSSACTTTSTRLTTGTSCAAPRASCCTTCAWARRREKTTFVVDLSGDEERGLFIPPGVAHGFASLTDVLLWYLVDSYYNPADELGLAWDDPTVGADWGVVDPVLSPRDQRNPLRDEIPDALRPHAGLRT